MNQDNQLVARAISGDPAALNLLLDNNKTYIYAIAFAVLKNHEDAEDAVQKTMITVWQSIRSLEHPQAFQSWLYRIAHTRSLNVLQSKKKDRYLINEDISDIRGIEQMQSELMLPQEYAERADLAERLNRIIDSLSPVQRETVVLFYYNQMPVAEIGRIMDCSVNTVKSRLFLARNSIKTEIEAQERKSGERFFGITAGGLPLGRFVVGNVNRHLPPAEIFTRLMASAQQAAFSVQGAAAAASAVKGASTGLAIALKVALVAAGVAVIATIGAAWISHAQKNQPTPTEGSSAVASQSATEPSDGGSQTDKETEPPVEPPTEPPTEPPQLAAYRSYLEALQDNESAIRDYDWQKSPDGTRPIVFADIMGDETPELIYTYADRVQGQYQGVNSGYAGMRILTYQDGTVKTVYEDDMISQTVAQAEFAYFLFQTTDSKELYLFHDTSKTFRGFQLYRFHDNGDGTLDKETLADFSDIEPREELSRFVVEGENVGKDDVIEYARSVLNKNASTLMVSTMSGNDRQYDRLDNFLNVSSFDKPNQAMTYDEAIAYLKEQTD